MVLRSGFAAAVLASCCLAGPPLTTIQDVLYKADGTRFNGTLTVSWNSFDAAGDSTIVTQSTQVKVTEGNLRVQLVPTTSGVPAAYYSVTYNSDGRIQSQETWSVPSSAIPLRVRDVRVAAGTALAQDSGTAGSVPIQEADVVGLIADLGARPLKGPGFAAGRVAVVSAVGALESVTGDPLDCVRVDGSTGPCGAVAPSFVDGDAPAGIVDGANTQFTLTGLPSPASSLAVYRNGLLQKPGQDYSASGRNIQFVAAGAPQAGDTLLASYRLTGTSPDPPLLFPNPQVMCSGTGASTTAAGSAELGTCTIPAGVLAMGDRVEILFNFEHQGAASGFAFDVLWGATTVLHRDAPSAETLAAGRVEAALLDAGAQVSAQSWGASLALSSGLAAAADAYRDGVTITFRGGLSAAGDTLALRNYTVVRFP
jgi:hypothetical protein